MKKEKSMGLTVYLMSDDESKTYHSLKNWLPRKVATLLKERTFAFVTSVNEDTNKTGVCMHFAADPLPCTSFTFHDFMDNKVGQIYWNHGYDFEFKDGLPVHCDSLESCIEKLLSICRRKA